MGSQPLAVVAALAAAVCFAINAVCQHHDVTRATAGRRMRLRQLTRLLSRPVWLFGSVAGLAAVALQTLALATGPVSVVQPLLVTVLVFALPATLLVQRRRPAAAEWAWAALLAGGLVLFLLAADPASGGADRVDATAMLVATLVLVVLDLVLVGFALRPGASYRAALLGAAAGVGYGIAGALGKYCLLQLEFGPLYVLAHWPVWTLLVVAVSSVVVAQTAFQAGPLAASLPLVAVAEPLVAVILGTTALAESVANTPAALAGEVVGALALAVGTVALARHTADL